MSFAVNFPLFTIVACLVCSVVSSVLDGKSNSSAFSASSTLHVSIPRCTAVPMFSASLRPMGTRQSRYRKRSFIGQA